MEENQVLLLSPQEGQESSLPSTAEGWFLQMALLQASVDMQRPPSDAGQSECTATHGHTPLHSQKA